MNLDGIILFSLLSRIPATIALFWSVVFGKTPHGHHLVSQEIQFTIFAWGFGKIIQDTEKGCRITLLFPLYVIIEEFEVDVFIK